MLTMYTTDWCGYCVRLKDGLERAGISFEEVNIERQPDAARGQGKAGRLMPWTPVAPDSLAGRLADWLTSVPGTVRVAVDGPPCVAPEGLVEALLEELRLRGRPGAH